MTSPVLLVIYMLAAARLTGLIVSDTITEPLRDALVSWLDDRPKTLGAFIVGVIECQWCAGMWVGFIVAPLMWAFSDSPVMLIPAIALASSQVTGMIAGFGR